jgi:cytochrome b
VSAVEWPLGILTLVAVLMVFYSFVVAPWLDEHDRRTRARDAAAWAEAIEANKRLHDHWDEVTKRGPR